MEQVGLGDIKLFSEVRWRFIKANLLAKLAHLLGFPQSPLSLERVTQWMGLIGTHDLGLVTVDLSRVVGTQGDCAEFDRAFRPRMGGILQVEWETAGSVIRQSLRPPVLKLYQWGEAFFILNRHDEVLVSVLKALGQRTIRSYVIGPDKALAPRRWLIGACRINRNQPTGSQWADYESGAENYCWRMEMYWRGKKNSYSA